MVGRFFQFIDERTPAFADMTFTTIKPDWKCDLPKFAVAYSLTFNIVNCSAQWALHNHLVCRVSLPPLLWLVNDGARYAVDFRQIPIILLGLRCVSFTT